MSTAAMTSSLRISESGSFQRGDQDTLLPNSTVCLVLFDHILLKQLTNNLSRITILPIWYIK